jgi:hypothetical protein
VVGFWEYFLLLLSWVLQVGVVVCSVYRNSFRRYLPLNTYMLVSMGSSLGVLLCMKKFGLSSHQYFYAYYATDLLLCLSLYLVVIHLYQHALGETAVKKYVNSGGLALLVLTCAFSYLSARRSGHEVGPSFVLELEQNLNFVGVALTYVLWGAIMKLHETRTRLIQLILALGIYFSATAAAYAVRALFPQFSEHLISQWAPPLISVWLPLAWIYAFWTISDESRVLRGQLAGSRA